MFRTGTVRKFAGHDLGGAALRLPGVGLAVNPGRRI